jgi:hypothetical protein
VETAQDVWLFVSNIDIRNQEDLLLRQQYTKGALQAKGIIPK